VEVTRIYHTTKTAAEYLGIPEVNLYYHLKKHNIKTTVKFYHKKRIPVEEIERLKECLN
jgi:predicted site-specific integrase-resolvase